MQQKLVPNRYFILVNNAKQALDAKNSLKITDIVFFIGTQSVLVDKVIKNKRLQELVTNLFSGCKTSSQEFLDYLYII